MKWQIFILMILVFFPIAYAVDINSCGTLNTNGATYNLTTGISGNLSNGVCLDITGTNIILDCGDNTVTGTVTGTTGIYVHDNATVRNCDISDYEIGIYFNNTNDSTLENNWFIDNTWDFSSEGDSNNNLITDFIIIENVNFIETYLDFTYDGEIKLVSVDGSGIADPTGKTDISHFVNITNSTPNSWIFLNMTYEDFHWVSHQNPNSYDLTDPQWSSPANVVDGDWNTYGQSGGSGSADGYVNYTKDLNAVNSLWEVKDGAGRVNLTVPANCFAQSPLQFKIISYQNGGYAGRWDCWTGSSWSLRRYNQGVSSYIRMYDEAVHYNRSDFPTSVIDWSYTEIWKYSGGQWHDPTNVGDPSQNGINIAGDYVYANITNFSSIYAPMGSTCVDEDYDGFGNGSFDLSQCTYANYTDCNDLDPTIHPLVNDTTLYLYHNLTVCTGNYERPVVSLESDYLTLDCNYSYIDTIGSPTIAILTAKDNSTIQNCNINSMFNAIYVTNGADNGIIRNNNLTTSTLSGVYVSGTNNNWHIYNNYINSSGYNGFHLVLDNSIIENNRIDFSADNGILLNGANNTVQHNILDWNNKGIFILDNNNTLINNTITNSVNWDITSSSGVIDNKIYDLYLDNEELNFTFFGSILLKETSPVADPFGWTNISHYLEIQNNSIAWIYLNLTYEDVDIPSNIINSTIKFWKNSSGTWNENVGSPNTINEPSKYVYANITNFSSVYAPLGEISCVDNDSDGFGYFGRSGCTYAGYSDCNDNDNTTHPLVNNTQLYINYNYTVCTDTYNESEIYVSVDNLSIDCNNSVLNGNSSLYGVTIAGRSNINVSNCNFNNYDYGVFMLVSDYNNIFNNNFSNSNNGVSTINLADYNNIYDNIFTSNIYGVDLQVGDFNNIYNNNFVGSTSYGVYSTLGSTNNNIYLNNFTTGQSGIFLKGSAYNISNNNFNSVSFNAIRISTGSNSILNNNNFYGTTSNYISTSSLDSNNIITNATLNDTTVSFTYDGDLRLNQDNGIGKTDPTGWTNISHYVDVTGTGGDWIFLNVSYQDSDIPPTILNNDTIKIWRWNSSWSNPSLVGSPNEIDQTNKIIYANITNFNSTYAPMGSLCVDVDNDGFGQYGSASCTYPIYIDCNDADNQTHPLLNNTQITPNYNLTICQDTYNNSSIYVNTVDDLIINCNNSILDGLDDGSTNFVSFVNSERGELFDCRIEDYKYGVYLVNGGYHNIHHNNFTSNTEGIYTTTSTEYNDIEFNNFNSNTDGIIITSGTYFDIFNNTFTSNTRGIYGQVPTTIGSNIIDNNFTSNTYGTYLRGNTYTIENNNFIGNSYGFYSNLFLDSNITNNYFYNNAIMDIRTYFQDSGNTFTNATLNDTTVSFNYDGTLHIKDDDSTGIPNPPYRTTLTHFVDINESYAGSWIFLNISYQDSDIPPTVLDNSTIKIWKYNGSWYDDTYVGSPNGINETLKIIYANITDFNTTYVPTGVTCIDYDNDGFGIGNTSACLYAGYTDCDDSNANIHPLLNNTLMNLNHSLTVCTDTYDNSRVDMIDSSITLNCNNSILIGNNSGYGITLTGETYNVIRDCTISNYTRGIYIDSTSDYNDILYNTFYDNVDGIWLRWSDNTQIYYNEFYNNSDGIEARGSILNEFKHNFAYENSRGIYLNGDENNFEVDNNTIYDNTYGLYYYGSRDDDTTNNNIYDNDYGIWLRNARNHDIYNNNITNSAIWDFYSTEAGSYGNDIQNLRLNDTIVSFTYDGEIRVKDASSPASDPYGYKNLSHYVNVTGTGGDWIFLNITYADSDIPSLVTNSTIQIWKYSGGWYDGSYVGTPNTINEPSKYVYANITNFSSIYAPMGATCIDNDADGFGTSVTTGCAYPTYIDCNDADNQTHPLLNNTVWNLTYDLTVCTDTYNNARVDVIGNNLNLNCNNSILNGVGTNNAIEITDQNFTTIENCQIINYDNGFYLNNTNNDTLNDNYLLNNNWDFVSEGLSFNNTITNITTGNTRSDFLYNGTVHFRDSDGVGLTNPLYYTNISHYLNITGTDWLYINLYYQQSDIPLTVTYENTTRLWKYSSGSWHNETFVGSPNNVNIISNIVYANITNFSSIFAPMSYMSTPPNLTNFSYPSCIEVGQIGNFNLTINYTPVNSTWLNITTPYMTSIYQDWGNASGNLSYNLTETYSVGEHRFIIRTTDYAGYFQQSNGTVEVRWDCGIGDEYEYTIPISLGIFAVIFAVLSFMISTKWIFFSELFLILCEVAVVGAVSITSEFIGTNGTLEALILILLAVLTLTIFIIFIQFFIYIFSLWNYNVGKGKRYR